MTLSDTLRIHDVQIEQFGGASGIRDMGLLESALGQPAATFGEVYLRRTLFDRAAAYLFHIVSNHPFIDGNKRTGLAAALVFLNPNGAPIRRGESKLSRLTIEIAVGGPSKSDIADRLRRIAKI